MSTEPRKNIERAVVLRNAADRTCRISGELMTTSFALVAEARLRRESRFALEHVGAAWSATYRVGPVTAWGDCPLEARTALNVLLEGRRLAARHCPPLPSQH